SYTSPQRIHQRHPNLARPLSRAGEQIISSEKFLELWKDAGGIDILLKQINGIVSVDADCNELEVSDILKQ
ncbi:MAG: hypothetical protein WBB64_03825, partial [Anaerolineales bacterium]